MDDVVLVIGQADVSDECLRVGEALGRLLGARLRTEVAGPEHAGQLLTAMSDSATVACVMPAPSAPDALAWDVLTRAVKPLVLVPAGSRLRHGSIQRALLPLDGTEESAIAVARTAHMLDRAGVELVVLHVFDRATVPSFWDQRAHAPAAWAAEFLARCGIPTQARLELRSGLPGEHVVRAADTERVDLIALGWARNLAPGRADTVRRCVTESPVPVLLVPIVAAM